MITETLDRASTSRRRVNDNGPFHALKPFQDDAADTIVEVVRDTAQKMMLDSTRRRAIALAQGAVLLRAPTGSGKTLIIARALEKVTGTLGVRTVWFWFTPYSGLATQTEDVIRSQTRGLKLQDIRGDRIASIRRDGDIYVSTWALVATGRKEARKVRTESDEIPSLDQMIHALRVKGYFIGAVIDEAHINFGANAKQAATFYLETPVLCSCRHQIRADDGIGSSSLAAFG